MIKTTQTWKIGDCLKLLPEIPDKSVDLILTDIPYDVLPDIKWLKECHRIMKDTASIFVFSSRQQNRFLNQQLDSLGFIERRIIIWVRKRDKNNCRGTALVGEYEPLSYYTKSEEYCFNDLKISPKEHLRNRKEYVSGILKDGITLSDVWSDVPALPWNHKNKCHPFQKPLTLMKRIILMASNTNDMVLDPFLGSGTTLEACFNTNRNCMGFEISNEWEPYYIKRLHLDTPKIKPIQTLNTDQLLVEI